MQLVNPRQNNSTKFDPHVDNSEMGPKPNLAGKIITYISFILIIPLILFIVGRNKLVRLQNRINEASSGIDVQLKKRRDTLIKLVDASKSSMKFEKSLLTDVTKLRKGMPKNIDNRVAQTDALQSRIMATFEAYPDIKSTQNIAKLMDASEDIEREIAATRRLYNSYVNEFNTKIFVWPSSVVAADMKLVKLPLFVASVEDRQDVSLKMDV